MKSKTRLTLDELDVVLLQNISQGEGFNKYLALLTQKAVQTISDRITKLEDLGLVKIKEMEEKHHFNGYVLSDVGQLLVSRSVISYNVNFLKLNEEGLLYQDNGQMLLRFKG
jgi:hypothetical protein